MEVELAAALNCIGLLQCIFEGVLTEAPVCPTCCHFHSTFACTAPRPCPLAMLIPILLLIASYILILILILSYAAAVFEIESLPAGCPWKLFSDKTCLVDVPSTLSAPPMAA